LHGYRSHSDVCSGKRGDIAVLELPAQFVPSVLVVLNMLNDVPNMNLLEIVSALTVSLWGQ